MKKIITRLAAVSAVAITALSSIGTTAFAYDVTSQNIRNLDCRQNCNGRFYVWSTTNQQSGLPNFGSEDLSQAVTAKILYGSSGYICGTLDKGFANTSNLSNLQKYFDRLSVTDKNGQLYGAQLEYDGCAENNIFAVRMMDSEYSKSSFNRLSLDSFSFNSSTGKYTGKFILSDYYFAGMKLSCGDGKTTFKAPVLTYDEDWDEFCTVIEFSGSTADSNNLYFGSLQTTILNNLKVTYNGGSYTTNNFKKTVNSCAPSNSYYTGICVGSDLATKISSYNKTRFQNNQFVGVKASGNTLYICFGKNSGTVPSTSTLKSLLKAGGRETIVFNNWIRNNVTKYSKVVITYNATTTSIGTSLRSFSNTNTFLNDIDDIYWDRKY